MKHETITYQIGTGEDITTWECLARIEQKAIAALFILRLTIIPN